MHTMNKLIISLLSISVLLIYTSCGPSKMTTSSEEIAPEIPANYASVSDEDLAEGKTLYSTHCSTCHALKKETNYTIEQWEQIVPKMVIKANKKNPDSVDSTMEQKILNYVAIASLGN